MTRVNDAMARAGAAEDIPAMPSGPDVVGSGLTPDDLAGESWAAEVPEGDEGPPTVGEDARPTEDLGSILTVSAPPRTSTGKLVLNDGVEVSSVEQYRRLAARLYLAQAERGTSLVMVTSAVMEEGKTLTATNLALTLSESYKKRVLLIDADLRRPGVHAVFGVPNVTGLNDGVAPDIDRKVPLIRLTDNLSVLTAGRPESDPMSVLSSERMRRILRDAAAAFDWVIVDTPPVAVLSDAHLLASLVDTVVLVVRAGATPLHSIKAAADAVGRDRIFGVVLNRVQAAGNSDAYSYYGRPVGDTVQGA